MTAPTITRNATLQDLAALLQDQQSRKLDIVASPTAIRSKDGILHISGTDVVIDESGVTPVAGQYRPTAIFDEGISDKLGIPLSYVRRLRNERPDLYDANVNGLLRGKTIMRANGTNDLPLTAETIYEADSRSFMLRCFRSDEPGSMGVARAFLSNSYGIIDNFDYVTALLEGVRQADIANPEIKVDLTDRRMVVKITVPELWVEAENLLAGYRSPYSGKTGTDSKRIFAGLVGSNSEVGNGAWTVTPRVEVEACSNGLVQTMDVERGVHLTSRQNDGIIQWSEDTKAKELAVVTAKTRDAVSTFLNVDYVKHAIERMERAAGVELSAPQETIEIVAAKLKFTKEQTAGIFDHFIRGGQVTAGGIMQAITSYSQTLDDADTAFDLDNQAVKAMELAAVRR